VVVEEVIIIIIMVVTGHVRICIVCVYNLERPIVTTAMSTTPLVGTRPREQDCNGI
jgi:hypothetical protein